jgi:hypothetical protein
LTVLVQVGRRCGWLGFKAVTAATARRGSQLENGSEPRCNGKSDEYELRSLDFHDRAAPLPIFTLIVIAGAAGKFST